MMFPKNWRILITGITSIHGWPVWKSISSRLPIDRVYGIRSPKMKIPQGHNISSLCITDRKALLELKNEFQPTHIIHGAGVCDLDVCEDRPQWAHELNVEGTKGIAEIFGLDSYIMYLSTDLVFSGKNPPQKGYSEKHLPDPVSVAGKTFAMAEKELSQCPRHSIIRLGLPLGDSITGDKGGIDWTESRFKKQRPVTLFYDEIRSCISCEEIARIVPKLLIKEIQGVYHLGGKKPISLYEMGKLVLKRGPYAPELLNPLSIHEEKNGPPRIANVTMNSEKLYQLIS